MAWKGKAEVICRSNRKWSEGEFEACWDRGKGGREVWSYEGKGGKEGRFEGKEVSVMGYRKGGRIVVTIERKEIRAKVVIK